MALSVALLRTLQSAPPTAAWAALFDHAWTTCAMPVTSGRVVSEIARRDAELAAVDLFIATAGWDLWRDYESSAPRTAEALVTWWVANPPGRAVLILDALSLREIPWILQSAVERGYVINQQRATGAELPADTTPFANALGWTTRSTLDNNGGSRSGRLKGARTESTALPWEDCAKLIDAAPDWVLWHHWPDDRLHELGAPGQGLNALSKESAERLRSDEFWGLIDQLTTGRRLIITADHGYAASGTFPDMVDPIQAQYLKERLKSGRCAAVSSDDTLVEGTWVPPLDLRLRTAHADARFALGRRKWKSQGGYPTLAHGGLSLLEVAVPFVELSRGGR
jgi:hypothetical protein